MIYACALQQRKVINHLVATDVHNLPTERACDNESLREITLQSWLVQYPYFVCIMSVLHSEHRVGRFRPKGDFPCGGGNARVDDDETDLRSFETFKGSEDRRVSPHDRSNSGAHRDATRARGGGTSCLVKEGEQQEVAACGRLIAITCPDHVVSRTNRAFLHVLTRALVSGVVELLN